MVLNETDHIKTLNIDERTAMVLNSDQLLNVSSQLPNNGQLVNTPLPLKNDGQLINIRSPLRNNDRSINVLLPLQDNGIIPQHTSPSNDVFMNDESPGDNQSYDYDYDDLPDHLIKLRADNQEIIEQFDKKIEKVGGKINTVRAELNEMNRQLRQLVQEKKKKKRRNFLTCLTKKFVCGKKTRFMVSHIKK